MLPQLLLPLLLAAVSAADEKSLPACSGALGTEQVLLQHAMLAKHRLEREGNASSGSSDEDEVEEECYTSMEGEECHSAVVWAQHHGVLENPEFYQGLTHHSSFEEFQDFLKARGETSCYRPCNLCRTAIKGDRCFEKVEWAMLVGIREHPDWYPGLASGSSFEEFQSLLHGGSEGDCPTAPCSLCRTVTEPGELCYKEVDWAMTHGIHSHPEWYLGLSANSSRAEFQQYLSLKYDCPPVCGLCHTAEPGEPCHEGVMWAMKYGIEAHPAWYPELGANSSFEDFQAHLHQGKFQNCPMPCGLEAE